MALSGSLNSNAYDGRYIQLTWTATQNATNNTSTISWTLKGAGKASVGFYKAGAFKVTIDGAQVYSSATRIELYEGTTVASGTKTINHNADGTKSFNISIEAGIYYTAVNCTGSKNFTLNQIGRGATLTSATNFSLTQNPTITYSNPQGNSVTSLQACISIVNDAPLIVYRDVSKTGNSYTFPLTDTEKEILISSTSGTSRSVTFILKTVINGVETLSKLSRTFTKNTDEVGPALNPTVTDINTTTTNLTGNNKKFVKGFSTAQCLVNASTTSGTISSQKVIHNGTTMIGSAPIFYNVSNNVFTFSATDSAGQTSTKSVEVDMIDYVKPSCSYETTMGATSATLNARGNYWNGNFGKVQNTLSVQYRYKKGTGSYSSWQNMNVTLQGTDAYTATITLTGLDTKATYYFDVRAADKLTTSTAGSQGGASTTPVFDWGANDFKFNVPVNMTQGFTTPNFNPADIESGTWIPVSANIASPTQAAGWYLKIGDTVIIGWCIYGTATTTDTYFRITGYPYPADDYFKWYGGGGNMQNGYAAGTQFFCGYCIESGAIYARAATYGATAGNRSSGYMGSQSGTTIYSSGTICYLLE